MEPYDVFVQWKRGKPHEYAETVNAADDEMALMLAKRNIDLRSEPLGIWVAPRKAFTSTSTESDSSLVPSTDREYRMVTGYANKPVEASE